jgi:hypothetical protein
MPIRSSIIADRNGRPAPAPIGTGITSVSATAPLILTLTGSVLTGSIDTGALPARTRVEKNGTLVGVRGTLNLIEGANVTLTVVDDAVNDEIDVTVEAADNPSPASAVEAATSFGVAPDVGVSTDYARADHQHGTPADPGGGGTPGDTVEDETSFGVAPAAGVATEYSRADHTHGSPPIAAATSGQLVVRNASTGVVGRIPITAEETATDLGLEVFGKGLIIDAREGDSGIDLRAKGFKVSDPEDTGIVLIDVDYDDADQKGIVIRRHLTVLNADGDYLLYVFADNIQMNGTVLVNGEVAATVPMLAPVGSGALWFAAAAPTGWLLCDGSAVSRATYAALFAVVGEVYGAGDGSTTFNLPDLRQRFPLGKAASGTGNALGATGGAIDHTHSYSGTTGGASDLLTAAAGVNTTLAEEHTHDFSGDTGENNPPFLVVNFIVKT